MISKIGKKNQIIIFIYHDKVLYMSTFIFNIYFFKIDRP